MTLDTTRADAMGEATPAFAALERRGRRFTRAYATVPETLPSHSSMMTGLYPAGHGIHENGRNLGDAQPLAAERLKSVGYETAAFVSSFVLARRFGLGRGFDVYDDVEGAERPARETTDRAIEWLQRGSEKARFVWVHYFDAHAPYTPPEPFRTRYAKNPYLGEIAAADEQLSRLVLAFEKNARGPVAIVVVGDHGEGLGEHGESQHGHLLYEGTMRVPLVVTGPTVAAASSDAPVSTRRIFNTLLDFAGLETRNSLRGTSSDEVVLGEAMKPFLEYGWQPQIMAIDGVQKTISSGRNELYDIVADPQESRDLSASVTPSRAARTALLDYPVPSVAETRSPSSLGDEDKKKLASLGYVSAGAVPIVRKDAPRPADMTGLLGVIETASGLFVREEYAKAAPLFERILLEDPHNLDAALRLATVHSVLGHDTQAIQAFERARRLAPDSPDVRAYFALHLARGARWAEAVPLLEKVVAESPERLPALEALARLRERQGLSRDAISVWRQVHGLRKATAAELVKVGVMAMDIEDTETAIRAFEEARDLQGPAFRNNLELGVLYIVSRRFENARDALDRVSAQHPAFAMALFKRAQVSVLLREPDQAARIEQARRGADATTRKLIARELLFQGGSR